MNPGLSSPPSKTMAWSSAEKYGSRGIQSVLTDFSVEKATTSSASGMPILPLMALTLWSGGVRRSATLTVSPIRTCPGEGEKEKVAPAAINGECGARIAKEKSTPITTRPLATRIAGPTPNDNFISLHSTGRKRTVEEGWG